MKREYPFYANSIRDLANGKSCPHIPFPFADYDTLKYLNTFLLALFYLCVDPYCISRPKIRDISPHLLVFKLFYDIHIYSKTIASIGAKPQSSSLISSHPIRFSGYFVASRSRMIAAAVLTER